MSEPRRPTGNGSSAGPQSVGLRVVGLGNPHAGDDSVGLEIVQKLRARGENGCEFVALPQAGAELLPWLEGAEAVLFVDAVTSGAPAGTLHLAPLPSPNLEPRALTAVSSHGWGLVEALGLAKALGRPIPRLILLGIEAGTVEPGTLCSVPVEAAIQLVLARFSELRGMLVKAESSAWRAPRHFAPNDPSFPGGL